MNATEWHAWCSRPTSGTDPSRQFFFSVSHLSHSTRWRNAWENYSGRQMAFKSKHSLCYLFLFSKWNFLSSLLFGKQEEKITTSPMSSSPPLNEKSIDKSRATMVIPIIFEVDRRDWWVTSAAKNPCCFSVCGWAHRASRDSSVFSSTTFNTFFKNLGRAQIYVFSLSPTPWTFYAPFGCEGIC